MPSSQIERKLAAIMFTDIAGYTESMSKDEAVAISLLNKKESVLKPLIAKHNGTYVKSTGDGSLSYFNSAVDAATCAKRFQESIYDDKDLNVRVGVHLGDTIFEKGDIRGDGVNIASRLESMAVEGGVFVSKEVHDQLANQKEFEGVSLGLQSMKGVGRLIEVYGLKGDRLSEPNPNEYQENKIDKHSDDKVPSIAIIPFRNKGKEEDAFYAYGISEDLISDVTSAGLIRVASKQQIEDAGKLPIDELAKKLNVRYMANGELWRMGDMFQLSIELYDTKNKKVVWSDRWQEKWDNLPTIKMNLSDGLLKALDTTYKVERKVETTNTEAYEFYLKAMYKYDKRENIDDVEIARGLIQKAIELDDNLIIAKILLGRTYMVSGDYKKATELYKIALKQSKKNDNIRLMMQINSNIGIISAYKNNFTAALEYFTKALEFSEDMDNKPDIASSLNNIGLSYTYLGKYNKALNIFSRCQKIYEELDDDDGMTYVFDNISIIYKNIGEFNKANDYLKKSMAISEKLGHKADFANSHSLLAHNYTMLGEYDKAIVYYTYSLKISEELKEMRKVGNDNNYLGLVFFYKNDYNNAEKYLKMAIKIFGETGDKLLLVESYTYLYLIYKNIGKEYDEKIIQSCIKDNKNIAGNVYYHLYLLLEDINYLEKAYNDLQEQVKQIKDDLKAKFLSCPIPKAIVEEWEKVK